MFDRRRFLFGAAATSVAGLLAGCGTAAQKTLNLADIGVGDPGDWSRFTDASGWGVNLAAIGNAPSTLINAMRTGGVQSYDVLHVMGGIQHPLVELETILPIEVDRIPNWSQNTYIQDFMAAGRPGYDHISMDGQVFGVPTLLQGESICYRPDATQETIESFGALFDPRWRGNVALDSNYSGSFQKTAIYLKHAGLAEIEDAADPTPSEANTIANYLIEKKKEGQFRVLWSSYQQAIELMLSGEVIIMDGWEPMVYEARTKGVKWAYAVPVEGYIMWAMAAYVTADETRSPERTEAVYQLLNFLLDPWYGAKISALRGYLTNSLAPSFAAQHPDLFSEADIVEIASVHDRGAQKPAQASIWFKRWPSHIDAIESEWARFKAA